jgi:RNA polymerase sigma factor (sigma-70 family)
MTKMRQLDLGIDEEQAITHRILALEVAVGDLVSSVPECSVILRTRRGRVGRTRAAAVARLEAAVEALDRVEGHREVRTAARAKWRESEQLRWRLALSATRIVYREAHRLGNNPNLAEQDLIQEGFLGLLAAAKRYEPSRDTRFATYARWWVRAQMTRAVDLARVVQLSAGATEQLRNLRKQIRIYEAAGTRWTMADIAADMGLERDRVQYLLGLGAARSLDEPAEDGEPAELQLRDDSTPSPDDAYQERQQIERLHTALGTLPQRLQRVVARRYGIGQEPRTLEEIARGMSLSRERVRQLQHQSLASLHAACLDEGISADR